MVQRKVPNKLGLQFDHHVKSQNQNKGASDLKKKKMKKSGSIKRPELDSLCCPSLKKPAPNYMKSTSSFDARKEQSQAQVSTNSPCSRRNVSSNLAKVGSCCGNKSTKTSAKTSSLKMMRSLRKNPSFKPARGYVKKCSPVVLCENFDVQKATCSSTLKDCKFPDYLSLSPEGTSTVEVCSYTYCSLNGHHHRAPLPPLKCFLSARRRVIKTQRSMKMGCLSPRRVKPVGDGSSFDKKVPMPDDIKSSPISPMAEEEYADFFIEIYSNKSEDTADDTGIDGRDETAAEDREERAMETLSDTPISYDEDVLESIDENRDVNAGDTDNICFSGQNQEAKVDEEVSPPLSAQEERNLDYDYEYEYSPKRKMEPDEFMIESDNKGGNFDDVLADEVSQGSFDAESLNSDAFSTLDNSESADSFDHLLSLKDANASEVPAEEPEPTHETNLLKDPLDETVTSSDEDQHVQTEFHDEDQTSNTENQENSTENIITSAITDPAKESHSEVSQKLKAMNAAKKLVQDDDESGLFNPRGPNFLPLQADPQAEKVDLKHQDLDERKNAEEWMVDYALRKVVTKLGPARKRKVALLVEAFEKVMPVTKCEIHLRDGSGFDQPRTIQACS